MAVAPEPTDMTAEDFLVWCLEQDERYELVDGVPVAMRPTAGRAGTPTQAMAGASRSHDRITSNIIGALYGQLRDGPCWAATSDTALRTKIKRMRRPDVTIECAAPDAQTYEAQNPVAAFEVLSPTTERTDKMTKLPEYMKHPTLKTIALIEPGKMDVLVYQRDENDEWQGKRYKLSADEIEIAGTVAKLALAEIYSGVPL
jgi:Uma2 family endonuclease